VVAEGDRIITLSSCRCNAVHGLLQLWVEDPEAVGQTSPELLRSLVDEVVDRCYPHIDRIHDQVESLEDQVFESRCLEPAAALCMKRELLEVRRLLAPLRDTTQALLRHGDPWASKEITQEYQDILSHILRHIESLDLARDILSTIMDAQLSLTSNRLNEVMRVLTVVSTLMMACSLVAGIYGMNFDVMPETKWLYGYPFSLGVMGLVCVLILWIFRRQRWI
jgi:magnesium transporter